jgi:hypothetical protein
VTGSGKIVATPGKTVTYGKTVTLVPAVPTKEKVKPPSTQPLSGNGGSVHALEKHVKLTA